MQHPQLRSLGATGFAADLTPCGSRRVAFRLRYVRRLSQLGDDGRLMGRTYSAPRKWMRGKGRVTVQMGCCYNYARDKQGNPPAILPNEPVCGMPPFLHDIIDRMVARGIFTESTRP